MLWELRTFQQPRGFQGNSNYIPKGTEVALVRCALDERRASASFILFYLFFEASFLCVALAVLEFSL